MTGCFVYFSQLTEGEQLEQMWVFIYTVEGTNPEHVYIINNILKVEEEKMCDDDSTTSFALSVQS